MTKRRVYERHGVQEYWLVHPTDRILAVYRLMGTEYGKRDVHELASETPIGAPIGALPGLTILWDALAARLPRPEY